MADTVVAKADIGIRRPREKYKGPDQDPHYRIHTVDIGSTMKAPGPRLRNFHWVGTRAAGNTAGEVPKSDATILNIFIVVF